MLQNILDNDKIMSYLLERANFTEPQLDTLLVSILKKDELRINQMVSLRDGERVSKGSFVRTLKQAQRNLEKSLYTVIIAEYLSILDNSSLLSLIRIGEVLKEIQTKKINTKEAQPILTQISSAVSDICRK